MSRGFRMNEPHVGCEAFEGEVVVIHFGSGRYYSIRGGSARVWDRLAAGASVADVAGWLARSHGVPAADAARDVEDFAAALLAAGLLVEAPALASSETGGDAAPLTGPYVAPRFEGYDDIADQLLLDKIDDEADAPVRIDEPSRP